MPTSRNSGDLDKDNQASAHLRRRRPKSQPDEPSNAVTSMTTGDKGANGKGDDSKQNSGDNWFTSTNRWYFCGFASRQQRGMVVTVFAVACVIMGGGVILIPPGHAQDILDGFTPSPTVKFVNLIFSFGVFTFTTSKFWGNDVDGFRVRRVLFIAWEVPYDQLLFYFGLTVTACWWTYLALVRYVWYDNVYGVPGSLPFVEVFVQWVESSTVIVNVFSVLEILAIMALEKAQEKEESVEADFRDFLQEEHSFTFRELKSTENFIGHNKEWSMFHLLWPPALRPLYLLNTKSKVTPTHIEEYVVQVREYKEHVKSQFRKNVRRQCWCLRDWRVDCLLSGSSPLGLTQRSQPDADKQQQEVEDLRSMHVIMGALASPLFPHWERAYALGFNLAVVYRDGLRSLFLARHDFRRALMETSEEELGAMSCLDEDLLSRNIPSTVVLVSPTVGVTVLRSSCLVEMNFLNRTVNMNTVDAVVPFVAHSISMKKIDRAAELLREAQQRIIEKVPSGDRSTKAVVPMAIVSPRMVASRHHAVEQGDNNDINKSAETERLVSTAASATFFPHPILGDEFASADEKKQASGGFTGSDVGVVASVARETNVVSVTVALPPVREDGKEQSEQSAQKQQQASVELGVAGPTKQRTEEEKSVVNAQWSAILEESQPASPNGGGAPASVEMGPLGSTVAQIATSLPAPVELKAIAESASAAQHHACLEATQAAALLLTDPTHHLIGTHVEDKLPPGALQEVVVDDMKNDNDSPNAASSSGQMLKVGPQLDPGKLTVVQADGSDLHPHEELAKTRDADGKQPSPSAKEDENVSGDSSTAPSGGNQAADESKDSVPEELESPSAATEHENEKAPSPSANEQLIDEQERKLEEEFKKRAKDEEAKADALKHTAALVDLDHSREQEAFEQDLRQALQEAKRKEDEEKEKEQEQDKGSEEKGQEKGDASTASPRAVAVPTPSAAATTTIPLGTADEQGKEENAPRLVLPKVEAQAVSITTHDQRLHEVMNERSAGRSPDWFDQQIALLQLLKAKVALYRNEQALKYADGVKEEDLGDSDSDDDERNSDDDEPGDVAAISVSGRDGSKQERAASRHRRRYFQRKNRGKLSDLEVQRLEDEQKHLQSTIELLTAPTETKLHTIVAGYWFPQHRRQIAAMQGAFVAYEYERAIVLQVRMPPKASDDQSDANAKAATESNE